MILPQITQENVHIFIPYKVAKATEMLMQNHEMNMENALMTIYNSDAYNALEREETKMWHEGATYIYKSVLQQFD